jgi:hypothetical protein
MVVRCLFLAEYPSMLKPGVLRDLVMDFVNDETAAHRARRGFRAALDHAALPSKLD